MNIQDWFLLEWTGWISMQSNRLSRVFSNTTEKARKFQKNIYLYFINYAKAFDCEDHDKLWKALEEMGIPDHLTCLLRNLYVGQKATFRTLYETTDRFKIEKGVWQGCLLSPCLFNLYAEHIMRNAGLDELQAGIKMGEKHQQSQNMWMIPF